MTEPTIKFSHRYCKMPPGFERSILLEVLPVKLENLSSMFLEYDTAYFDENCREANYPLPKKGDYLLLILCADGVDLWTTIRRATPEKERYYKSMIGKPFRCVVEEAGGR